MCMAKSKDFGMYFTEDGACECEIDCGYVCMGCDKYFCEIKDENNLDHGMELPEAESTDSDNNYCHIHCFRDSH